MGEKTTLKETLPPGAQKMIAKRGIGLSNSANEKSRKRRYTKAQLTIYNGYDLLEHMAVVRRFLCARYECHIEVLEAIWKIAPAENQFFTLEDYRAMVVDTPRSKIKVMLEKGFISEVTHAAWKSKKLFTLSQHGRHINTMTYEYLSGERTVPMYRADNPLIKESRTNKAAKSTLKLIKKLNVTPVPESKSKFFE